MTNVYAWPPVGLTGWEATRLDPVSRSESLIDGRARTSSAGRARRLATAIVPGINKDQSGAGYVENLKRLLAGGEHLVRVPWRSAIWFLADRPPGLVTQRLLFTSGEVDLEFTSGGVDLLFGTGVNMIGAPATDDGWDAITVTGLPPNTIVARPSDTIEVRDETTEELRTVLALARSDGSGEAVIRILGGPITLTGHVSIGTEEQVLLEALGMPRAVQPLDGDWSYTWNFREVFADEYGSLTELNPWG